MMRMKTRFHRVMGASKRELPFNFRNWGSGGKAHILKEGRMRHRQSSVLLKVTQALRTRVSRSPVQCLPSPHTRCKQPIFSSISTQGDLGRPVLLERRHSLELSLGDANRIHLLGFTIGFLLFAHW